MSQPQQEQQNQQQQQQQQQPVEEASSSVAPAVMFTSFDHGQPLASSSAENNNNNSSEAQTTNEVPTSEAQQPQQQQEEQQQQQQQESVLPSFAAFDTSATTTTDAEQQQLIPTEFTAVTCADSAALIRNATLSAQDAVVYSARPTFARTITSNGGFLVRVATGAAQDPAEQQQQKQMLYRVGRITQVYELDHPYKCRGLYTDIELEVDTMPGARVRLTSISNSQITPEEFEEYILASSDVAGEGASGKFELNPIAHEQNLRALAQTLRAIFKSELVNRVFNEQEQAKVIERNEKLNRARRNLAGEVNSFASKIELILQQSQQEKLQQYQNRLQGDGGSNTQQQQQQQMMTQDVYGGGADDEQQQQQNNNNMMMMMMASQNQSSPSQSFDHQQNNSNNTDEGGDDMSVLPSLDTLPEHLVEELMMANNRFSSYVKNSTSTIPHMITLTERNRKKNELIVLRGERLRTLRDQQLIEQGLLTEPDDNIWTLDISERSELALAHNDKKTRDKTNDPKLILENAAEDFHSKPERIRQQALKEATQFFSNSSHKQNNSQEKSSSSGANGSGHSSRDVNSILGRFGSKDLLNRLLRDAQQQQGTSSSSPSSQIRNSSSSSQATTTSSNDSFATAALFSIPRRRPRQQIQQPQQQTSSSNIQQQRDEGTTNPPLNSAVLARHEQQQHAKELMLGM